MKAKYLFTAITTLLLLLAFTPKTYSQDQMDFEEFMGMMSQTFTEQQLDEMSYQLPWDVKISAYAYGDFSNDGTTDIVLSLVEKGVTPPNSVDVYVLKSIADQSYRVVEKRNYKYYEIPLEIAFLVQNGQCYITHRDDDNWYFTAYKISEAMNFEQQDEESFPLDFGKAGK